MSAKDSPRLIFMISLNSVLTSAHLAFLAFNLGCPALEDCVVLSAYQVTVELDQRLTVDNAPIFRSKLVAMLDQLDAEPTQTVLNTKSVVSMDKEQFVLLSTMVGPN